MSVYPEHDWKPWFFSTSLITPHDHREYMDWMGKELGLQSLDHWYGVKEEDVQSRGGSKVLMKYENNLIKGMKG
jgi:hypothetical protein